MKYDGRASAQRSVRGVKVGAEKKRKENPDA